MRKLIIVCTVVVLGFLSACTVEPEVYTIQFDVDQGEALADYEYTAGELFELPNDPIKEGHSFLGWYYDQEYTEKFSLKDGVTRSLILYAMWETDVYTVMIHLNTIDDGLPTLVTVSFGGTIYEPQAPTKARAEFDGWYADDQFINEFDFTTPIYRGTSIYAKWIENDVLLIGANIYTFNDNFMYGLIKPELERYAIEREVELLMVDSEYDQATLNDQVDVFIDQGVDVLMINLVDPAAARTIINKAKAADIPLILFNKEAWEGGVMESYDKVWYVGIDIAESGIVQGEMMVADWQANTNWDLNDDGVLDYVMLKGEPGHPYAEARTLEAVKAFTDAGITVNELAIQASPTWSTADAKNTMDAWLTASFADDIELVICNNDGMAFGAIQALDAVSKKIPVYGLDALQQALTMIGDGDLTGTVLHDGQAVARAAIDLAINAALGNDILEGTDYELDSSSTKAVRIPFVPITYSNYLDYLDQY